MTSIALRVGVPFALFLTTSAGVVGGCSAVVSPNADRLGRSDGGPGSDSAVSTIDSGQPGVDSGQPGVDSGSAVCSVLLVDCGGVCVDLARDPLHCGGCGTPCAAGGVCTSGRCGGGGCPPGDPTCGGLSDATNCGPSHVTCGGDQLCVGGMCICRPPLSPGPGGCIDLMSDPNNCGTPGVRCADACAFGACVGGCPGTTRDCNGACVNTRSDPLNCGGCDQPCDPSQACQSGSCQDISPAAGCLGCPCDACGGRPCCLLPRIGVPYCIDADACP